MPLRPRVLAQQRRQSLPPALAKHAHQLQAGRPACPRALRTQARDVELRAGGHRLVRFTPDAEQPQRGDGDSQPQARRPLGMAHPRAVPLPPARFVLFKPCSSHARRPYHPASLASGASSVRSSQGALSPASQRASTVQATWVRVKARPVPRQRARAGAPSSSRAARRLPRPAESCRPC